MGRVFCLSNQFSLAMSLAIRHNEYMTTTTATTTPRILGITDEITTCDHCGREGLKRTVALCMADGEIVHYGTTCAANSFPKLGKGADIAKSAAKRCDCGCGEFARNITAGGVKFLDDACFARIKAA
jgi:hypothetical protein